MAALRAGDLSPLPAGQAPTELGKEQWRRDVQISTLQTIAAEAAVCIICHSFRCWAQLPLPQELLCFGFLGKVYVREIQSDPALDRFCQNPCFETQGQLVLRQGEEDTSGYDGDFPDAVFGQIQRRGRDLAMVSREAQV